MWPFSAPYPIHSPANVDGSEYDYVIVGGGTAGCVLAARLSEDPSIKVLLVERGPIVDTWASHVPLFSSDYSTATAPVYRWAASPVVGTANMTLFSGKAMGGTSKVNASIYTRSVPGEYNAWTAAGRKGWGWDDVEPLFKKSEKSLTHTSSPHRGHNGPWHNQRFKRIEFKFIDAFTSVVPELGIPFFEESNNPASPPVSCQKLDVTVDANGRRQSTFDAFLPLKIVRARASNLHLCPMTVVTSLDLQNDDAGVRVTGVFLEDEVDVDEENVNRPRFRVRAKREVILCAGAIATPQVLMLSGIGPAPHLRAKGVNVVVDLPGVGADLQDHMGVALIYSAPRDDTVHKLFNPIVFIRELFKYLFAADGLLLSPFAQVALFALSNKLDDGSITHAAGTLDAADPANVPDIEIMPIPIAASDYDFKKELGSRGGVSIYCVVVKPRSSGAVRLSSLDPRARPTCELNPLTDPVDVVAMRKALRLGLSIGRKIRATGYSLRDLQVPQSETDEDLDAFMRKNVRTVYHYASSCRMLPRAEGGVVDDELRVHGVQGLRIADASVFPGIPACHTQVPAAMVAEKCAILLKQSY